MQTYKDINCDSGIARYEIGPDYIILEFKNDKPNKLKFYKYTYSSAGISCIEHMKRLACKGNGLNKFISENKPQHLHKY